MRERMNVTDDPIVRWLFDPLGMSFTTETNTDLRLTQQVATVAYLDKFVFHYNRRKTKGVGRRAAQMLEHIVTEPPMPFRQLLIAKAITDG